MLTLFLRGGVFIVALLFQSFSAQPLKTAPLESEQSEQSEQSAQALQQCDPNSLPGYNLEGDSFNLDRLFAESEHMTSKSGGFSGMLKGLATLYKVPTHILNIGHCLGLIDEKWALSKEDLADFDRAFNPENRERVLQDFYRLLAFHQEENTKRLQESIAKQSGNPEAAETSVFDHAQQKYLQDRREQTVLWVNVFVTQLIHLHRAGDIKGQENLFKQLFSLRDQVKDQLPGEWSNAWSLHEIAAHHDFLFLETTLAFFKPSSKEWNAETLLKGAGEALSLLKTVYHPANLIGDGINAGFSKVQEHFSLNNLDLKLNFNLAQAEREESERSLFSMLDTSLLLAQDVLGLHSLAALAGYGMPMAFGVTATTVLASAYLGSGLAQAGYTAYMDGVDAGVAELSSHLYGRGLHLAFSQVRRFIPSPEFDAYRSWPYMAFLTEKAVHMMQQYAAMAALKQVCKLPTTLMQAGPMVKQSLWKFTDKIMTSMSCKMPQII